MPDLTIKGLEGFDKLGRDLKNARKAAIADATNALAKKAIKDADKEVRKIYTIKRKTRFKKALRFIKASSLSTNPVAYIAVVSNKPIGYAGYAHTASKKRGVTVRLRRDKGSFTLAQGFRVRVDGVQQISGRSRKGGGTYSSGYRARQASCAGQRRDKLLRPAGPSPNRMMRDVGFNAIQTNIDLADYGERLSASMVKQLKRKGF